MGKDIVQISVKLTVQRRASRVYPFRSTWKCLWTQCSRTKLSATACLGDSFANRCNQNRRQESSTKSSRTTRIRRIRWAYDGVGNFSTVGIDPYADGAVGQFEKYDRGGSIPAPDTEEGSPIRVDPDVSGEPAPSWMGYGGERTTSSQFGGRRWSHHPDKNFCPLAL